MDGDVQICVLILNNLVTYNVFVCTSTRVHVGIPLDLNLDLDLLNLVDLIHSMYIFFNRILGTRILVRYNLYCTVPG
eukprot:SAG11_NODE_2199_length_3697_cov_2.182324_2_plen_77_part_00